MGARSGIVLLALALLGGCGGGGGGAPEGSGEGGTDGAAAAGPTDPIGPGPEGEPRWFVDTAVERGLDFVHFNGASGEFYFPEIMAPGVGVLDYDNDGDLDVYFVQGQMLGAETTTSNAALSPPGSVRPAGRLYRNDLQVHADGTRALRFTDVTTERDRGAQLRHGDGNGGRGQ